MRYDAHMSRARELTRLVSTWATGSAFREHVRESDGVRTFFHPTAEVPPAMLHVGVLVSVSLRFADRDTDFHVHARVVERVATDAARGLVLAFLPEEKDRQELVLASAEGESVPYLRRKAVRTACDLAVLVALEDGTTFESVMSTISERGAHLETASLGPDQRVHLRIALPDRQPRIEVAGRVTSKIVGLQEGVGIEFIFTSSKQRDAVAAQVAAFRSRDVIG